MQINLHYYLFMLDYGFLTLINDKNNVEGNVLYITLAYIV